MNEQEEEEGRKENKKEQEEEERKSGNYWHVLKPKDINEREKERKKHEKTK